MTSMLSLPSLPSLPSIPSILSPLPSLPGVMLPTSDVPSIPTLPTVDVMPQIPQFTLDQPAAVIPPTSFLPPPSMGGVIRIVKEERPTNFTMINFDGKSSLNPKNITITWVSPRVLINGVPTVYGGWTAEGTKQSVTCTISRFIACSKIPAKYLNSSGGIDVEFFNTRYSKMTSTTALGGGKKRGTDTIQHYYCDGRIFTEREFFAYVIGPVYVQAIERLPDFITLQSNIGRESYAIKSKTVISDRTVPNTLEAATLALSTSTTPFTLEDALGFAIRGFKPWM